MASAPALLPVFLNQTAFSHVEIPTSRSVPLHGFRAEVMETPRSARFTSPSDLRERCHDISVISVRELSDREDYPFSLNDSHAISSPIRIPDSKRRREKRKDETGEVKIYNMRVLQQLIKQDSGRFFPDPLLARDIRQIVKNESETINIFDHMKVDRCRKVLVFTFLQYMPKVELHTHLTGAVYGEHYWELALKMGLSFDPKTALFHKEEAPGRIPSKELMGPEHLALRAKFIECTSMRSKKDEDNGHDYFFRACTVTESVAQHVPIVDLLHLVLKNAIKQNICYKELMVDLPVTMPLSEDFLTGYKPTPDDFTTSLQVLRDENLLSNYVETHTKSLAKSCATVAEKLSVDSITDGTGPIQVKYLVEVMRTQPNPQFFVAIASAMALIVANPSVVGINIVGPEDAPVAISNFSEQMKILEFLHASFDKPNITLHAGELTIDLSSPVSMSSRIKDSIVTGKAKRIGHAVSLMHEGREFFETVKLMRDNRVAVEVCLSSNDYILGIKDDDHPISYYIEKNVPVTINTDDEGINRSSLTMEFERAVDSYDFSYKQLKQFVRNGIEYSFLPGPSIFSDPMNFIFKDEFRYAASPHWKLSKKGCVLTPKVAMQIKLEREFAKFEALMCKEK